MGPTGTGKSETALRLAARLGGEIVGCDALQVYVGLDAATAKPTAEARRAVPHHLVDVADPRRDFSLADYVRLASRAVEEIEGRGRIPIVVGGTGLYLRGLLRGIVVAPGRDETLRSRLRRMAARFGPERLHRWLARLDPDTASRLNPRDTQRILRGLEIALTGGGVTWGELLRRQGSWQAGEERYPSLKFGLDLDRARLGQILQRRVEGFFAAGLVEEVERLLAAGVPETANAFKGIGYREVLAAIREGRDPRGVLDEVVRSTRRYAKRQRTWFRKEPGVLWLDASAGPEALAAQIAAVWEASARAGRPRES